MFVLTMITLNSIGFAQDTLKVEPIEFGLPEAPSVSWRARDKYGSDTTEWPTWLQKGFDRSKGMVLEVIDEESIRINDTLKLMLNTNQSFVVEPADTSISKHFRNMYFQDNLVFIQRDSLIDFLSLKEPLKIVF